MFHVRSKKNIGLNAIFDLKVIQKYSEYKEKQITE